MIDHNDKHKFSTCAHCACPLYFEDKRKRIESGAWTHAVCFAAGNYKPYPVPHQVANGMKHTGTPVSLYSNGNGHAAPEIIVPPPTTSGKGILENLLEEYAARTTNGINEEAVRNLIREELAQITPPPVTIEVKALDGSIKTIAGAHKQTPQLMALIAKRKHVYCWGAPGSLKSTTARTCADALGLPFAFKSLGPWDDGSSIMGYMNAAGVYVGTDFERLYRTGGVFCFEEMDNSSAVLQTTLNSLLDNGHGSFPYGMVAKHQDFIVLANGNTNGNGGNIQFPERQALATAFKGRFAYLKWEYDTAQEESITLSINPAARPWMKWVQAVRDYAAENDIRLVASPRESFNGAALLSDKIFSLEQLAEMVVFKGLDADIVKNIYRACPLPYIEGR